MLKFICMLLAMFVFNKAQTTTVETMMPNVMYVASAVSAPQTERVNAVNLIKKAVIKAFDTMRRRIFWWSELLTITAILWGIGAAFRILSWVPRVGAAWTSYASTLLFIGGAVFFLIWFFQMAARLD